MTQRLLLIGIFYLITTVNSQCARCRNRDTGVIQTIDFIRQFHLSETHDTVAGSVQTQNAYRLTEESLLSAESRQIFTVTIPYNFWFESTFRVREQNYRPWYLIHITDSQGVTQISITMDAIQQVVGIGLPDINGNVQRVFFQHSNIFDQNWHKILVSIVKDKVKMWIDCQAVLGARGQYEETLLPRKKFDTANGYTHIARYVDDTNQFQYEASTSQIDLQWMVLGCESTRPQPNCSELQYSESAPDLEIIPKQTTIRPYIPTTYAPIRQECPIQCPQGPPGPPGQDGQSIIGEKGERGERGFVGESIIGQKGEKGEPGLIISKFEGETRNFGELEIREICGSILREQLAELKPSLLGPIGPPGPPGMSRPGRPGLKGDRGDDGFPGRQGERGEKGERGEDGRNGSPGVQGLPGVEGIAGPPGRPGERGEDGRNGTPGVPGSPGQCPNDCYYTQMYMQQLQAAHAQQQTKGPSPQNLYTKG